MDLRFCLSLQRGANLAMAAIATGLLTWKIWIAEICKMNWKVNFDQRNSFLLRVKVQDKFVSVLAFSPTKNGDFRKRRFRVQVWTGENEGFQKRWRDDWLIWHRLDNLILLSTTHALYWPLSYISSVIAFTCGRAKTIRRETYVFKNVRIRVDSRRLILHITKIQLFQAFNFCC